MFWIMTAVLSAVFAGLTSFFTAPQKGSDQPHLTAVKTPRTAKTVQVEQVPEERVSTAETAFVSDISETETEVEPEKTIATESEVVTAEPEMFTEEKTPSVQETITEESIEITEEKVTTEPEEETVECIDEGDQSLAEYKPQIGNQPNPFENDTPTEIDDRLVEDYVGEGEDRPGEGKHF